MGSYNLFWPPGYMTESTEFHVGLGVLRTVGFRLTIVLARLPIEVEFGVGKLILYDVY